MADKQELKLEESKSSSKLLIIIIAVVIGLAIGGSVAFFLIGGSDDEVQNEAQVQIGPGMVAPTAEHVFYVKFEEPFMIQLHVKPRERLAQIYIVLTTKTLEDKELGQIHQLLIKSVLSATLSGADTQLYNDQTGREKIKEQCLKAVQDALFSETGKAVVDKVLFTGFVMQ